MPLARRHGIFSVAQYELCRLYRGGSQLASITDACKSSTRKALIILLRSASGVTSLEPEGNISHARSVVTGIVRFCTRFPANHCLSPCRGGGLNRLFGPAFRNQYRYQ
jgi:hypothetical protein